MLVAGVVEISYLDTRLPPASRRKSRSRRESRYEDDRNGKVQLTGGWDLFGGRGHFVISADAYKNDGVPNYADRDWFNSCALIGNPAKTPQYLRDCNAHSAEFTWGGMVSTGPLKGTQFGRRWRPHALQLRQPRDGQDHGRRFGCGGANPDVGAYFQADPGGGVATSICSTATLM